MDGWMDGRTDGRTDGLMDGRMDGWTDGRTDDRVRVFQSAGLRLEALLIKRFGAVRDLPKVSAVLTSRRSG
jgi:hypothetical protein